MEQGAAPQRADDSGEAILARLESLQQEVSRISHRLEEITSYVALRLNKIADSQSIYLGDSTALTFLASGHRMYVDTRSVDIGSHLLTFGIWETHYAEAFRRLIRPGDMVFDIGANHGFYTLLSADATGPTGHVHAFEANPRLAALTTMSVHINGFGNRAEVHEVAVGSGKGEVELSFSHEWSGGGSLFAAGREHSVRCQLVSLDEMFSNPEFRIDVVKMDVEGAEGLALRGMRQLLERSADVRMMIEFAPEMLNGTDVGAAELVSMLRNLGFRAWTIEANSDLLEVAWDELSAATGGLQNLIVSR